MNVVIAFEKQHTYQTVVDATRNGSTGIITSPGYPRNYPDNAAYKWTLKTGNLNATVSFNFYDFDIKKYEHTLHCEDYLQIYESKPCCFKAIHRCGKFEPFSLTVHGSVITIYFVSDNLHNTKGFNLTWTVYIPSTPAVRKTSVWTSKIQTKLSAKIMCTTGPKKLGTTDPEIPTSKTENNMRTSSRTSSNREETSLMKNNTGKMLTIFLLTKSAKEGNIIIPTAPASPNKLQKSLVRNDKRKMLATLMTVKSQTEGKITIPTDRFSTYQLKASLLTTSPRKILTNFISTESKTEENMYITIPTARASTNKVDASIVSSNTTKKMITILLSTKSETKESITIHTARASTNKVEASIVTTNPTRKLLTNFLSTKSKTEGNMYITIPTARTSTNKVDASVVTSNTTRKIFTIFLSTKSETKESITIPTVYLVNGINILLVILAVIGIYIVKRRQTNPRSWTLNQGGSKRTQTIPTLA